jgi:hypothetical protein
MPTKLVSSILANLAGDTLEYRLDSHTSCRRENATSFTLSLLRSISPAQAILECSEAADTPPLTKFQPNERPITVPKIVLVSRWHEHDYEVRDL